MCFLASRGEVPTGLDAPNDTLPVYRLERLPRALPWETVQALLTAIDQATPMGRRDYAIVLLNAEGPKCISGSQPVTLV